MKIVRRIGDAPRLRGDCSTGETCPDIFELSDGRFAVIGTLADDLPGGAARGDREQAVVITRQTLIRAKRDIPDA
ncbi:MULTISPECIES: hypothetical protein [unclassified Streptomyces]|uniref:hypothetical protein n=1 Tax=unclassified Streptomyces TaxID=2593676 RepID=UPI00278BB4DE|nr:MULTISPECIES: hypothetical protein [unclassified Streptomyces]